MSKTGLSLLSLCLGLAIGILVARFFLSDRPATPSDPQAQHAMASGPQEFYYRLNDSLITRHTVGESDTGMYHKIDTIVVKMQEADTASYDAPAPNE